MPNYTIALTDTEDKALSNVAYSQQDWIDNAIKERCRVAIEDIIARNMAHCNANEITIATGQDAQVTQAFTLGVVKTNKALTDERNKAMGIE
tara:strand:- start:93 stop:368 length:276 start_codon:yes stop_codon:yes gene_type:complete